MYQIALLAAFEFKHLLADFFLQTEKHLGKFKEKGWFLPLADHCAIHGIFTLLLVLIVNGDLWWLALVDFWAHLAMDRIKASPYLLGRFKPVTAEQYIKCKELIANCQRMGIPNSPECLKAQAQLDSNVRFWHSIGVDQFVHQLTTLFIVWKLCQ